MTASKWDQGSAAIIAALITAINIIAAATIAASSISSSSSSISSSSSSSSRNQIALSIDLHATWYKPTLNFKLLNLNFKL